MKNDFPILAGENIALRPFILKDAVSLSVHANNKSIADNLNDGFPYPYTEKNAIEFITGMHHSQTPNILAIVFNDEVIGAIGIFPLTKVQRLNAEIGYWIGEKYWGRGITTKAVRAMLAYAFINFDVIRIFARPFPHNLASQKVLEKSGLRLEARIKNGLCKNNIIFDELIYSILKEQVV